MNKQKNEKNTLRKRAILGFAIGIAIVLLIVAFCLDLTYYNVIKCKCMLSFFGFVKSLMEPVGFRYSKALDILTRNVGVLVTTFSLILTMGVNIANRFEGKVFGITRQELYSSDIRKIYSNLRKIV